MSNEEPVDVAREPFHHTVFENENLRILNVEIPPQKSTLLHRHKHDYYLVILGAADIEDRVLNEPPERKIFHGGEMSAGKAGLTHLVMNVGMAPFRNLVIEVKRK